MRKNLYIFLVVSYNIGKHIGKSTRKLNGSDAIMETICVIILRAKEAAIEMLKGGKLSVEEIAQYVPALSVDDVKKL